ncbi:hypothetical protein RvVAR031_37270 [Agrobacterium vitis]|nr:hypothetical protein RvVAR031_37270 [Agrobacterium vitis]
MLTKQAVSHVGQDLTFFVAMHFYGDIKFRIKANRPLVQIRRPNANENIIDDNQLGMDQNFLAIIIAALIWDNGIESTKPTKPISLSKLADHSVSIFPEYFSLEKSMRIQRRNQYDLRAIRLTQSRRQKIGDIFRCKILAFYIYEPLCPRQAVKGQL